MARRQFAALAVLFLIVGSRGLLASAAEASPIKVQAPGLGDPGPLQTMVFETTPTNLLRGPDARQQLLVTGNYASGQLRDLTHAVTYEAAPAGIVTVDSTGYVIPLADGAVTITVKVATGQSQAATLKVEGFSHPTPINFTNQIVPIFTKLGCNSGGCHGKASGQNGFKLSLLGFYPNEDYEFLVKEGRGRRLFPAAPDKSLLLQKATNSMPHGGGHRIEVDSFEYQLIRRWLLQGMPFGSEKDPTVARIEVLPATRTLDRGSQQQVAVLAHYTDGSVEDVTRTAQLEANDSEMAEATPTGLVKTLDLTGDAAIMVRYQGQVGVFRGSIPLGLKVAQLPPAKNFIDTLVFEKLKLLGIPPSPVCDDGTFLRRVTVDITGQLPTAEQAEQFAADADPAKRDKLIDRLLASPAYADYFANKWGAILRNKRVNGNYMRGTYAFHGWIRDSLLRNRPYDEFVRGVLTASGEMGNNPPVAWYRALPTSSEQLEDTAQLFLGLRLQCAKCHHHPFEKWSQRDYYGFAAFFSRVARKNGVNGLQQQEEPRVFHNVGLATAQNPRSGENLKPTGLGSGALDIPADEDPRHSLVDWMADPANPFFSRALSNRYWKHFFGRGIVDPEDDMRVTNPASNPQLLDALAKHFVDTHFDLKQLVRTICQSTTYQLTSEPNDFNALDKQNYSRHYPKRLAAEVLYDALHQTTNTTAGFGGLPPGTRAVQLPDTAFNNYFLQVFGKPESESACECERSSEANLAQSLHLLNSSEIQGKLQSGGGRANVYAQDKRPDLHKVRELYFAVYSREPDPEEIFLTLGHLSRTENKQQAWEDILWALINTKEFLFNH